MFVPYLSPSVGPFYPSLIQYNTIQVIESSNILFECQKVNVTVVSSK